MITKKGVYLRCEWLTKDEIEYLLSADTSSYLIDKMDLYKLTDIINIDNHNPEYIIKYIKEDDKDEVTYSLGESLPLKEELPFTPYLITEDFIKSEYTVEEVIEFFNEKVKPSLASQEKELVK